MSVTTVSTRSSSRPRASASIRHRSGTTFVAVPPVIVPTFAVVSASSRPEPHGRDRSRRGDDRAAPVLGPDARVGRAAVDLGDDPLVGRGGDHDLTDRRGVIEDVAELHCEGAWGRTPWRRAGHSPRTP